MSPCTLFPILAERWTSVSSLLLQPPRWRAYTAGGRLLRWDLGIVSQSTIGAEEIFILVQFIYYQLFVRHFHYVIKIMTFVCIHWVTICVYLYLAHIWDAPGFTFKSGCDLDICQWCWWSNYISEWNKEMDLMAGRKQKCVASKIVVTTRSPKYINIF
jgi:hypothetical protein